MTTKINPPSYSKKKSYELYKQELLAWKEVTDLTKAKMGVVIALSLPEDDETKIREKVFDQISLDELKKDTGLDILITFLDKHLAKDDLADSLEKFEDFDDFKRETGQNIHDYIETFDSKYRKIEKKNMKLPSEILAFKLLRKANITKEEKLLVLTGMNYDDRETLYEQAKRSLKKFKGDKSVVSDSSSPSIRLEPVFLAENEEVLAAAGYFKAHSNYRGVGGTRWNRGRGTGTYKFRGNQTYQNKPPVDSNKNKKPVNPAGPDGRIWTCKSCGSFRHMLSDCPDSWENMAKVNIAEEEHVVLFTGYHKNDIARLGVDAQNCAVLDSACSSTVCGQNWLKHYIMTLNDTDKEKVKCYEGTKIFKFGGGTCLKSSGEYELPAVFVGKNVTVKTDVVDSDIPLLLSRTAMKNANVKLDLVNDTAVIMGKEVALNLTTSGHYCIPIDTSVEISVENVCTVKLDEMDEKQRHEILRKLHRQFAHPPEKRLISLLKDAGVWNDLYKKITSQIYDNCDMCKLYARTPSRPVVSMPMAKEFNEKVAMDLKYWNGKWILHMIDMWSRYTISVFINRKRPSDVIDAVMTNWIGVFGIMGALMTDNGGEFSSDEMREVASILDVKVCTTSGMSPFQNGLCERVHAVTDMMLLKLEADYGKVNSQTLLCWANMARNSLQMWNGYSSHQLVFGVSPNLPNVMRDTLPALDGTTMSETFAKHLNVLHSARKAFIQTEAAERIRRALRSKVRASEQVFENGDLVFYKRDGKERWLGPGKVVFQDGKIVFVRHGGVFVRVSPNRLCKTTNILINDKDIDSEKQNTYADNCTIGSNETKINKVQNNIPSVIETIPGKCDNMYESPVISQTLDSSCKLPLKANERIKFKQQNSDTWRSATILSRAGKATGTNKNWYNIQEESTEEKMSVDLGQLPWERIETEMANIVSLPTNNDTKSVIAAKQVELQKLKNFSTYETVKDTGQNTISTRWVINSKDGEIKARLVARGFEENGFIQRDSPSVEKSTMRIFLAIVSSMFWQVKTTDIKSAFLQGKELDRDVFLIPPLESELPKGVIWKLRHCLYGLKDGARQFYISVKEELLNLGLQQSRLDPAMFFLREREKLNGIICCHVDDFLHSGDENFGKIISKLTKRFLVSKVEENNFRYIGFQITQDERSIKLDHSHYLEKLEDIIIDPQRALQKQMPLNSDEQTTFRRIVGQLNWAVQGSRPDMAFEMIDLSTKMKSGTVGDLLRAIKIIRKLKDIKSMILFPALQPNVKEWKILVFSDASLANISDGTGSVGAHIIWLTDRQGHSCPLTWQSNKIKRVVRSTIAAEALSLQEGLEASYYIRDIIEDILGLESKALPILAFVDNKSVVESIMSTKQVDDRRLRLDIAAIRESLAHNDVKDVRWCSSKLQLANCMTKQGASSYQLLDILQNGRMIEEFV